MTFTDAQAEAIAARGNVLVMAGAGSGKTRTLVERCVQCLIREKPPVSINEILMVTFTEAAAAEMRERIRERIQEEIDKSSGGGPWREQLALFENAYIGTLHGFCLQLVRQYFYRLEVDPQVSVLAEEEARLLAEEALDAVFEPHYEGGAGRAEAVQRLLEAAGANDQSVRALLLKIHNYSQTLARPSEWFERELARFSSAEPKEWREWFAIELNDFLKRSIGHLQQLDPANEVARDCLSALSAAATPLSAQSAATLLPSLTAICQNCKRGKRTQWLGPIEEFCEEIEFFSSLCATPASPDPLAQDWQWILEPMLTLLELARDFSSAFSDAKRELGTADFHDLEQFALRLLWTDDDQPTDIASQWREKLHFIFVDEYQDINAAQDKIIEALSGAGSKANRFLVGDVKQSIYRFRLANPKIFQSYVGKWRPPDGITIPLVENFRSRERIVDFVNSIFDFLMRPQVGGIAYDSDARLIFGAPAERAAIRACSDQDGTPELHLVLKQTSQAVSSDPEPKGTSAVEELQDAEKEARLAASRLIELKSEGFSVWDIASNGFRPLEWSDVAILLRSPSGKAESYAKEFQRAGIPLRVERGGFYKALEISDLISLLQILDNPLQDIPLIAVLRSPIVGLTVNDLASIRLCDKGPFWSALLKFREVAADVRTRTSQSEHGTLNADHCIARFLDRFARWRRIARRVSLSSCLDAILAETRYDEWLSTQPRGEMRRANVGRLLHLARQFDQFQRQGLFRFLCFVEAQQLAEAEPEIASSSSEDAVRLMSIHQSKGLEFPVVVLGNISKTFNEQDMKAEILLDDLYGLAPMVRPPQSAKKYPSLSLWLARRRQKTELRGEELRLLYVAMTRARDKLILTGCVFARKWELLSEPRRLTESLLVSQVATARSFLDWLMIWLHGEGIDPSRQSGELSGLQWHLYDANPGATVADLKNGAPEKQSSTADDGISGEILDRLEWQYPFEASTSLPAKTSVSALRRWAADENLATPAHERFHRERKPATAISAIDAGNIHHIFLQHVHLPSVSSIDGLNAEKSRLISEGVLTDGQAVVLNVESIFKFWTSEAGEMILKNPRSVRRELPFTARFLQPEIDEIIGRKGAASPTDDFSVVQGVADLALLLPDEIWIVDFKTDSITKDDLARKLKTYAPQLKLYSAALGKIYKKPVARAFLYFLEIEHLAEVSAKATANALE
jgi:ATP-dependent helicase/nuclease subunit A